MQVGPSRAVPILPRPELVVFPGVTVPIHVDEVGQRTLVRDALAGERRVVVALLKPGWQRDDHPCPETFPLGCLAHVDEVTWLPDDHYDLVLRGVSRVLIGRTVREFPYRACRVTPAPQDPLSEDDPLIQLERRAVLDAYKRFTRVVWPEALDPSPSLDESLGFEALVNTICLMINVDARRLFPLLELDSVVDRSRRLRETMEAELRAPRRRSLGTQELN